MISRTWKKVSSVFYFQFCTNIAIHSHRGSKSVMYSHKLTQVLCIIPNVEYLIIPNTAVMH